MKKIITHIKQPTFELSDTPLVVETEEVEVADEYDLSYKFKWTTKPRLNIKDRAYKTICQHCSICNKWVFLDNHPYAKYLGTISIPFSQNVIGVNAYVVDLYQCNHPDLKRKGVFTGRFEDRAVDGHAWVENGWETGPEEIRIKLKQVRKEHGF